MIKKVLIKGTTTGLGSVSEVISWENCVGSKILQGMGKILIFLKVTELFESVQ